jgi:hypothetical protein
MSGHDERRRLPRRRTRLSAAAISGDEVVACTVRDKSETGARLLIETGKSVPDGFNLLELTAGELHRAQVIWRDAAFVGVTLHESRNLDRPRAEDQPFVEIRERLTARR